jgi:Tetratricopeptide repeat
MTAKVSSIAPRSNAPLHASAGHDSPIAERSATTAIALDPTNPDIHCVLGSGCAALGRLDTAAEAYREAVRLQPDDDQIAIKLRKIVPANLPTKSVVIETAPGELIDKITILEIKSERITDPDKRHNVRTELDWLRAARDRTILPSEEKSYHSADSASP